MAAKEMYDYLPGTASADYSATVMNIASQVVLPEQGRFVGQKSHKSDGATYLATTRNTTPRFVAKLRFNNTDASDVGTLLDFFLDTAKGKGIDRSFLWDHPTDGHRYIVKFNNVNLERDIRFLDDQGFGRFELAVVDRVDD